MIGIRVLPAAIVGLVAFGPDSASAQSVAYPQKEERLRIVLAFTAAGDVDNAAGLLGKELRKQAGANPSVDNRAGLGGMICSSAVKTSRTTTSAPYNPQTEFAPVAP